MKKKWFPLIVLSIPSLAFAAAKTFAELAAWLVTIINMLIAVMITGVVVLYFVGALRKMGNIAHDPKEMNRYLAWGAFAIFIMISIWGIVTLIKNSIVL